MLISLRRFLATLLIPMFLVILLITLFVFRVNATVLDPDFYTDFASDLNAYSFLYEEAIPFAIERAKENGDLTLDSVPLGIEFTPEVISALISEILPPEWLHKNLSASVNAAVPYIAGEVDEFSVTLTVDDRIDVASDVFQDLLLEADIDSFLINDNVQNQLDIVVLELPYGLVLTKEGITDGVIQVVPQDWLEERAASAITVAERWFLMSLEAGAYEYLLEEQIAPVVQLAIGHAAVLPYGVTVTSQEIIDALGVVMPPEWVAQRLTDALDAIGPYLISETDSFLIMIPLRDRAQLAASILVASVDDKFSSIYTSLRICAIEDLMGLTLTLNELPVCRPPLVTYEQFKGVVGLGILEELLQTFVQPLPDEVTVNEQTLFAALGDNASYFGTARGMLRDGFTFTDQNLIKLIEDRSPSPVQAADNVELFQKVRGYLRDGFTFSASDIEKQFEDKSELTTFNDIRGYIAQAKSLRWLFIIALSFIAVIIGFLGGRRWGTRLAWAGLPVVISGAITAFAFGPIASQGFKVVDDLISDIDDIDEIFISKLLDARVAMESMFVSPISTQSITLAAIGFAMITVGLYVVGRPRSSQGSSTIHY